MKDFLIQIGIGIIMLIGLLVAVLAIVLVWICVFIYEIIEWVAKYDGNHRDPIKILEDDYKAFLLKNPPPVDPELEAEFDKAFSAKPFPKPYSPSDNPMYVSPTVKEKKPKYNCRGPNGKFVKKIIALEPVRTPVTRYGASPMERFK